MGRKSCFYKSCKNCIMAPKQPPRVKDTFFIPFPKPSSEYHKCQRWVKAINRKGFAVTDVCSHHYVCSLHFPGGKGPTLENPDPVREGPLQDQVERCTSNASESYVEVKEEVADYNNPEFQRMQQVVANNFPAMQFCVYPSDVTYPLCYIPTNNNINKTIENTNSNCSVNQQNFSVESSFSRDQEHSSNISNFSSERNQTSNESVSIEQFKPTNIQQDPGRIISTTEQLKREFLLYQAEGYDTFYWYLKLGRNIPYLTFEKSDSLTNFVLIAITKSLEVKILPCNNSLNHSHELCSPKWRTVTSLKDLLRIMKYVNIWKVCEGVQDEVVMRYTDSLKCLYFCTNSHTLRSRKCSLLFPKVKYDNCNSCNMMQKLIIGTVRKYKKQGNLLEELAKLEDLEMTLEDSGI